MTTSEPQLGVPDDAPRVRPAQHEDLSSTPAAPERVRAVAVELLGRLKGIPHSPRVAGHLFEDAVEETELGEVDRARAFGLAMGVVENSAAIDRTISQVADAGQHVSTNAADLDILRLGVYEECVQAGRSVNRAVRYARRLRLQFRHEARAAAVQVLYESDLSGKPVDDIIEKRLGDTALTLEAQRLARWLVQCTIAHRETVNAKIAETAPAWPVNQMAAIDRTILSLAISELLYCEETPPKVVINEAVELAKRFGGDSTARLVNGALGAFMSHSQPRSAHGRDAATDHQLEGESA